MKPEDLRAWRAELHITQSTAAKALGVSRRTYVSYEQDGTELPRMLELACRYLTQRPDELVTMTLMSWEEVGEEMVAAPAAAASLRIALEHGRGAGVVEVAIAAATLVDLLVDRVLEPPAVKDLFATAIEQHNNSPAGDQVWTAGVVSYLRSLYYARAHSAVSAD